MFLRVQSGITVARPPGRCNHPQRQSLPCAPESPISGDSGSRGSDEKINETGEGLRARAGTFTPGFNPT